MIRKLLIPLAATALLAGCVTTAPYGYQGDAGDYYYGSPSVEYRYSGYGDPYYGYGPYRPGFSVWGSYGYPGYSYYGYPYYGSPYYGHPRPHPRPRPDTPAPPHRRDGGPWRHLDVVGGPQDARPGPRAAPPLSGAPWGNVREAIREHRDGASMPRPGRVMPEASRPHADFGGAPAPRATAPAPAPAPRFTAPAPRVSAPAQERTRRMPRPGARED